MMDHDETSEIHRLSHEITRLITRVDYHEKEIAAHNKTNESRFAKLEEKLDVLAKNINDVSVNVKEIMIKVGIGGLIVAMVIQILGKHFGIL